MEEQAKELAALFRLLANENRLLILCALLEKPMTVSEIAVFTPQISLPALSQHLQALRAAGLLSSEKKGQHVTYSLRDERVHHLFILLKEQYCSEKPKDNKKEAKEDG